MLNDYYKVQLVDVIVRPEYVGALSLIKKGRYGVSDRLIAPVVIAIAVSVAGVARAKSAIGDM